MCVFILADRTIWKENERRGLRENGIISIADQKILIKDKEYLEQYVKG